MAKPAASTSKQLSLGLSGQNAAAKKSGSRVVTLVDAKTAQIRRQAIERVAASGIFSVRRPGEK